jgi:antirestriction protein ArdC
MASALSLVTQNIIKVLESGEKLPWRKPWHVPSPTNVTGRKYSGINRVVLSSTDFREHRWITFKQAQALGGKVLKGEKGTPVVLWKRLESYLDKELEEGNRLICQNFTVFNIEQCSGIEIPNEDSRVEFSEDILKVVDTTIENFACRPLIKAGGEKAYYSPNKDLVNVPFHHHFNSSADWASTMFHELAHSCGHPSRLNRFSLDNPNPRGKLDYAFEELVAELTSAMLCSELGIIGNGEQNAAYIQSWLKGFKEKQFFLSQASSRAEKSVALILGLQS